MHDLLEGVVPMAIKFVLKFYVVEKKIFTIDYLNSRIHEFDYGPVEKKNKPSANFTIAMLTNNENNIKQYAIQCWLLLRILPFILFDKVVVIESDHI